MIACKISKNARIVFVGINPHPGSYRRGVPFSNNKMFWYLLNRAGLLNEVEKDLKDDASLKRIYDNKMFWYLLNRAGLLQEADSDLKLADGDRRRKSLSDAFSNPEPGGDPRERT